MLNVLLRWVAGREDLLDKSIESVTPFAELPWDRFEELRRMPCADPAAPERMVSILGGSEEAFFIEIDDRTLVSRRERGFL